MVTKMVRFKNLCCANCANKIEKKLNKIKGVKATMSYVASKLLLELDDISLYDECIRLCKEIEPDFMVVE